MRSPEKGIMDPRVWTLKKGNQVNLLNCFPSCRHKVGEKSPLHCSVSQLVDTGLIAFAVVIY